MSDFAMTIREMEEKDFAAVLEIQNATHFENWDEKALRNLWMKTYTFAFVAEIRLYLSSVAVTDGSSQVTTSPSDIAESSNRATIP